MTKLKFLLSLRDRISALPPGDVEERLSFYSEMIEDRVEEGFSEEEAVAAVGSVDEIAAQIIGEIPPAKPAAPKKNLKVWEIVLLALGSPIWFSLVIAVFAVVFSLFASLWAIFVSLAACAFAGIAVGIGFAIVGHGLTSVAMLGAGMICTGISIFLFCGCKEATSGILHLVKKIVLSVRNLFIHKEVA